MLHARMAASSVRGRMPSVWRRGGGVAPLATRALSSWSLLHTQLSLDGVPSPFELESGVLPVIGEDDELAAARTSGAASVLALHCSSASHQQWSALGTALRLQHDDAVAAYDALGEPEAPLWSTPRAVCAPNAFGHGGTSEWSKASLGVEKRAQCVEDHAALTWAAALSMNSSQVVHPRDKISSEEFISLLRTLNLSADGLEDLLRKKQVDAESASSAQPMHAGSKRWRLLGHGVGGATALHAASVNQQLASSLDALVVFEPSAFHLLADPRCKDAEAIGTFKAFCKSMLKHARNGDRSGWVEAYHDFWLAGGSEEIAWSDQLIDQTTRETLALLRAIEHAESHCSTDAVDALAGLQCPKHIIASAHPGAGASQPLAALQKLLQEHASFSVHTAPEGGHLAPVTHADTAMPLLASCLLDLISPHTRTRAKEPARLLLDLLRVPDKTSPAEVRRNYLRQAKLWHPDVSDEHNATERFAHLQACWEAYERVNPRPWTDKILENEESCEETKTTDRGEKRQLNSSS